MSPAAPGSGCTPDRIRGLTGLALGLMLVLHKREEPQMSDFIYRTALTPDADLAVESSGNVVLLTPERRITVTNVERWRDELAVARQLAQTLDPA